jgi:[ribosomal protein S5]-alanine N-acetyltransferase
MGLLQWLWEDEAQNTIVGPDHILRFPSVDDYEQWQTLRAASRRFLEPWEPTWSADELSKSSFRARIKRYSELRDDDAAYPFYLFTQKNRTLLGGVTLSNVRRGVSQSATLGYWMGEQHANQGHMTAALKMLLPHAFKQLGLHRVEAACLPRNEASIRLLEHAKFEREGFAKSYLKIAGHWEDHLLFGRRSD